MKVAYIGGAKATIASYKGKERYFLFNGAAMLELQAEYGNDFVGKMIETTKESLDILIKTAYVLTVQGELARREVGLDKTFLPTREEWGSVVRIQPHEILVLKNACLDAISLGYGREIKEDDEEIDLGLAELQKKRK